jgi:hypothetical protein
MGGICSTHEKMKNVYRIAVKEREEKRLLGDLGVNRRPILQSILDK